MCLQKDLHTKRRIQMLRLYLPLQKRLTRHLMQLKGCSIQLRPLMRVKSRKPLVSTKSTNNTRLSLIFSKNSSQATLYTKHYLSQWALLTRSNQLSCSNKRTLMETTWKRRIVPLESSNSMQINLCLYWRQTLKEWSIRWTLFRSMSQNQHCKKRLHASLPALTHRLR